MLVILWEIPFPLLFLIALYNWFEDCYHIYYENMRNENEKSFAEEKRKYRKSGRTLTGLNENVEWIFWKVFSYGIKSWVSISLTAVSDFKSSYQCLVFDDKVTKRNLDWKKILSISFRLYFFAYICSSRAQDKENDETVRLFF